MSEIKRSIYQRCMDSLSHPATVIAAALIIINALILQVQTPSLITGKLGGFGWMLLLPFLFAILANLLIPTAWLQKLELHRQGLAMDIIFLFGSLLAITFFIFLKAVPATNRLVVNLFYTIFHTPPKLLLDPTDLLALFMVFGSRKIWLNPLRKTPPYWRFAAMALIAFGLIADAPAGPVATFKCLIQQGDDLYAVRWVAYSDGSPGDTTERYIHRSQDGGLTWSGVVSYSPQATPAAGEDPFYLAATDCADKPRFNGKIISPYDELTQYLIISGDAIYRSTDGGQTFIRDYLLAPGTRVEDAIIDGQTGNIIVAMFPNELLVKQGEDWGYIPNLPWK